MKCTIPRNQAPKVRKEKEKEIKTNRPARVKITTEPIETEKMDPLLADHHSESLLYLLLSLLSLLLPLSLSFLSIIPFWMRWRHAHSLIQSLRSSNWRSSLVCLFFCYSSLMRLPNWLQKTSLRERNNIWSLWLSGIRYSVCIFSIIRE